MPQDCQDGRCSVIRTSNSHRKISLKPIVNSYIISSTQLYDTIAVKFPKKCEKYEFWDAFFVSPTDRTFLF